MMKYRFPLSLIAILAGLFSFIPSCGGGGAGNSNGSGACSTNTGAGWVTIDAPAATTPDSAFIRLTGTAFISPTWYRCCSGSADDTGVTISWSNSASGSSGIAYHAVEICYFFFQPYLCNHTWSATVPLALGSNTITVTASDPGTNSGSSCLTATRTPDLSPPMVYSVNPPDGTPNAWVGATVSADFSEVMLSTSITPSTFTFSGPGNVPLTGTISTTQIYSSSLSQFYTRADFQPLAALDVFATYTATIDGSVKDYAGGNSMGQAYTWHFTTGAPISGRITHPDGSGYGGVTVKIVEAATGAGSFVYTDSAGNFMFVAPRSGTYTITPFDSTCGTCLFTPTSRTATVNTTAVSGQDFIE
ncbi:MAG TPA: Ig-like domain-containing protein [Nitrospirota bacterium]|nr:Ig-like domain-containing protein [Nitrospirota bacterium]